MAEIFQNSSVFDSSGKPYAVRVWTVKQRRDFLLTLKKAEENPDPIKQFDELVNILVENTDIKKTDIEDMNASAFDELFNKLIKALIDGNKPSPLQTTV